MIFEFFEKRRIRKKLEELVNRSLSRNSISTFQKKEINFVCIAVRGDTTSIISERVGVVVGLALKHQAMVDTIVSEVVVVAYGTIDGLGGSASDSMQLRQDLCEHLKDNVKIVYGSETADVGLIGGDQRFSFSFVFSGFIEVLGKLGAMSFGESHEWKVKP